jgi:thiamine-monophosphate kinase
VSAEDRLIAQHFRPLARHPAALGLVDDCAVLPAPAGRDLVLKTDAIIGGVHFFADDPADKVARKALRVNLSDLAAKGARPEGFLLSMALPKRIDDRWLRSFARGLGEDADSFGCPLLGGDTDRTPGPVAISIAVIGSLPHGTMVLRSGARPGQRICLTGTIGDAALGLLLRRHAAGTQKLKLSRAERHHLLERYLLPRPRTAVADLIRQHAAAAMDISDGLVGDLTKLCAASAVSAEIDTAKIPLSDGARRALASRPALIETILTGGDDYEVVCTVEPKKVASFRAAAAEFGVPVTEIGVTGKDGAGVRFLDQNRQALLFKRSSFSHF